MTTAECFIFSGAHDCKKFVTWDKNLAVEVKHVKENRKERQNQKKLKASVTSIRVAHGGKVEGEKQTK